jgi:hypothetical protein
LKLVGKSLWDIKCVPHIRLQLLICSQVGFVVRFTIRKRDFRKLSRGSSGSIVSDYGLDDRAIEVLSPTGADFSSSPCVQTGYRMVTGGSFPGGKARPGRDADHSPPSSAEAKNE